MEERNVCVRIQRLTGHHMDLQLERSSVSTSNIKSHIENVWGVPTSCQDIVIGDKVLGGDDRAHMLTEFDSSLSVTLVTSQKGMRNLLKDLHEAQVRNLGNRQADGLAGFDRWVFCAQGCDALAALTTWSRSGYGCMISAVLSILEEERHNSHESKSYSDVNYAMQALKVLQMCSKQDDESVIVSLASCLEQANGKWEMFRMKPTEDIEFCTRLNQECRFTESVVDVLCHLSTRGDALAIKEVKARLGHPRGVVRITALKILGCISLRGDCNVITAVKEFVPEDSSPYCKLRHHQYIPGGDSRLIEIGTALVTLAKVASRGDPSIADLIASFLGSGWLSYDVVEALGQVVTDDNQDALEAMADLLERVPRRGVGTYHPQLRSHILKAFSDVGSISEPRVLKSISAVMSSEWDRWDSDSDEDNLHAAAAVTLMRIAPQGDEIAIGALSSRMKRFSRNKKRIAAALEHLKGPASASTCAGTR